MTYEYTGIYSDTFEQAKETDRLIKDLQMQMNFLDARIEQQLLRINGKEPPYKKTGTRV